jgi:hypothetical protein
MLAWMEIEPTGTRSRQISGMPEPFDYAKPDANEQRGIHPAVKWTLIVLFLSFIAFAILVALSTSYMQSLGPVFP